MNVNQRSHYIQLLLNSYLVMVSIVELLKLIYFRTFLVEVVMCRFRTIRAKLKKFISITPELYISHI